MDYQRLILQVNEGKLSLEDALHEAYDEGSYSGFSDGYDEGYSDGCESGRLRDLDGLDCRRDN